MRRDTEQCQAAASHILHSELPPALDDVEMYYASLRESLEYLVTAAPSLTSSAPQAPSLSVHGSPSQATKSIEPVLRYVESVREVVETTRTIDHARREIEFEEELNLQCVERYEHKKADLGFVKSDVENELRRLRHEVGPNAQSERHALETVIELQAAKRAALEREKQAAVDEYQQWCKKRHESLLHAQALHREASSIRMKACEIATFEIPAMKRSVLERVEEPQAREYLISLRNKEFSSLANEAICSNLTLRAGEVRNLIAVEQKKLAVVEEMISSVTVANSCGTPTPIEEIVLSLREQREAATKAVFEANSAIQRTEGEVYELESDVSYIYSPTNHAPPLRLTESIDVDSTELSQLQHEVAELEGRLDARQQHIISLSNDAERRIPLNMLNDTSDTARKEVQEIACRLQVDGDTIVDKYQRLYAQVVSITTEISNVERQQLSQDQYTSIGHYHALLEEAGARSTLVAELQHTIELIEGEVSTLVGQQQFANDVRRELQQQADTKQQELCRIHEVIEGTESNIARLKDRISRHNYDRALFEEEKQKRSAVLQERYLARMQRDEHLARRERKLHSADTPSEPHHSGNARRHIKGGSERDSYVITIETLDNRESRAHQQPHKRSRADVLNELSNQPPRVPVTNNKPSTHTWLHSFNGLGFSSGTRVVDENIL